MRTQPQRTKRVGRSAPDLTAPVSGIWQVLHASLACIRHPAQELDALLSLPPRTIEAFERTEHLDYLAYWEWCVAAIHPDQVVLATPIGAVRLPLAPRPAAFLQRQMHRRVQFAIGAGCSPAGARSSIRDSQQRAVERLAVAMPAGQVGLSNPIDVVADIIATQQVEPNNMTLATGATIDFIDHVISGEGGKTMAGIHRVWAIASRLGCTLTVQRGQRIYTVSPSTRPSREAQAAVAAGWSAQTPRWHTADPETRAIIAAVSAGTATVRSVATQLGVTPQAINARLHAAGCSMRELHYQAGLRAARARLRSWIDG